MTTGHVREVLGPDLTDAEAEALASNYATLAHLVSEFPIAELRAIEPPLRSFGAPRAASGGA